MFSPAFVVLQNDLHRISTGSSPPFTVYIRHFNQRSKRKQSSDHFLCLSVSRCTFCILILCLLWGPTSTMQFAFLYACDDVSLLLEMSFKPHLSQFLFFSPSLSQPIPPVHSRMDQVPSSVLSRMSLFHDTSCGILTCVTFYH